MVEVYFLIFTHKVGKSQIISNFEDTQVSSGRAINSIFVLFNFKDNILKLASFVVSENS